MNNLKYYLLKFEETIEIGSGADVDIDIIDVTYNRNDLVERMENILSDSSIETINGQHVDDEEYEIGSEEYIWDILYKSPESTVSRATYKILARAE